MSKLPRGIDLLPSGMYRGRFMYDGQRFATPPCRTLTEAKTALAALRTDVTRGEWVASRGGMSLDEWFAAWNPTRQVRDVTKAEDERRYARHIRPVLGHKSLRSLTPEVVASFQASLTCSVSTQRLVWALLSASLGRRGALRAGLVRVNPCSAVQAPRPQRGTIQPLTRQQVASLAAAMRPEHRIVLFAAVLTGLRWSELVGLAVEDWQRERGTLLVQRSVRERGGHFVVGATKGNRARTVPVHPLLADLLAEHLGERTRGPLLLTRANTPLRHGNYRRDAWLPALKKTGITARWHDLRHTHATWLLENGTDVTVVQELLGHADLHTTRLYLHNTDTRREEAIRALDLGESLRDHGVTLRERDVLVD